MTPGDGESRTLGLLKVLSQGRIIRGMRQRDGSLLWAWHTLAKTPFVLAPVAVALAFAGGSSAVTRVHHRNGRAVVPRLGAIIPQHLPPFIAYDSASQDGTTGGIFLIKPDGSDSHLVGPLLPYFAEEPSWSPSGSRILYQTGCAIWVMNADGSNQRLLVPADNCVSDQLDHPHWSPNGKRIVYTAFGRAGAGNPVIHTANADGSHDHRVPHTQGGESASFSPDGRYIVFDSNASTIMSHLYLIRPNGTGLREITPRYGGVDPSWSPDGTRIIYSCSIYANPLNLPPRSTGSPVIPQPAPHAICEISRTRPKPRRLYSVPSGSYIDGQTWSADGKTILLTTVAPNGVTQVALLPASGGTPVEITQGGSEPNW